MKRSILLASTLIVALAVSSCKTKKAQTSSTTVATTTTTTTTTTAPAETETETQPPSETSPSSTEAAPLPDDLKELWRVTVSFISKGEGIDLKTQEVFENWIKNQPKTPKYQKTHWGREGETNYCLKLDELSTREQEIFVRDLRTLLTDKPLVLISEYAECKGNPE
jgi:guanyl-specific ribonuclease Sa